MKIKIKIIKETSEKVVLKFPSIDVFISVSKRYFEILQKYNEYEILRME
ncbi:MAG: hypothetical protein ACJAT4_003141 [Granulosicoccus sp.]|jgi:hypothetical protein